MSTGKSNQKNNNRIKEKRKRRKQEILERRLQDQLYEEAKMDPNTVEGQATLDISRIYPDDKHTFDSVNDSNTKEEEGYFTKWYNYIWGT